MISTNPQQAKEVVGAATNLLGLGELVDPTSTTIVEMEYRRLTTFATGAINPAITFVSVPPTAILLMISNAPEILLVFLRVSSNQSKIQTPRIVKRGKSTAILTVIAWVA